MPWQARISDEAIFHQIDNSRIPKLWLALLKPIPETQILSKLPASDF